jgi:hypothetical protein
VDPALAAASGVLRDAVGAIHNLQHLLGSSKVGPKALLRVIPDVRSSCRPAMLAASELARSAVRVSGDSSSIAELGELLTARLGELEAALVSAKKFGAAERLAVESAVARAVRDLDAGLELADVLVEASAAAGVTLDASDVLRECTARADTGSGRGRKAVMTIGSCDDGVLVEANPRLAVRLLAFAVALVTGPNDAARVTLRRGSPGCVFGVSAVPLPGKGEPKGIVMLVPPVIGLSARVVAGAARVARATVSLDNDGRSASLALPLSPGE